MKYLFCPQCGIKRLLVKNAAGETRIVQVTDRYEIVPLKADESLDGFNTAMLFCLGCSWKGSAGQLRKYQV